MAAKAEGFLDACHLQLFETNPALRAQQAERLGQVQPLLGLEVDVGCRGSAAGRRQRVLRRHAHPPVRQGRGWLA